MSVRRVAGRIVEWNDDRGFGFVLPNGGDKKRFIHAKAFSALNRRPEVGDSVAFIPALDERGRPTAEEIRFNVAARVTEPETRKSSTAWRAVLGLVALACLGYAWQFRGLATTLATALIIANAFSLVMYSYDKNAATAHRQRTPEATLHLWALLGGWPGALIAQHVLRHKSRKASFQRVFWLTVIVNVGLGVWLAKSAQGQLILSWLGVFH